MTGDRVAEIRDEAREWLNLPRYDPETTVRLIDRLWNAFLGTEADLAALRDQRDEAQSLIGTIRNIVSRPGKKVEAVKEKLAGYHGDYEHTERRLAYRFRAGEDKLPGKQSVADHLRTENAALRAKLAAVEALHQPETVYEIEPVNGTWVYEGDERKVMAVLCSECTPEYIIEEIEDGYYDGPNDIDVTYPCATAAALATGEGEE